MIGNDEPVASEPGQVIAHGDWYDYEAKYTDGGMELVVPAPITAAQRERVRRIAQEAFLRSLVQRAGAGRLLRHRRGAGAPERAEHDPRVHRHERLLTPVRGVGDRLRGAAGPAAGAARSSGTSASALIRTSPAVRSRQSAGTSRRPPTADCALCQLSNFTSEIAALEPTRCSFRELRDPDQVVARALSCGVEREGLARRVHLAAGDQGPAGQGPGDAVAATCTSNSHPSFGVTIRIPRATIGRPASRYRPTPFLMLPRSGVS